MRQITTNSQPGDAGDAYPLDVLTRPLPSMMGLQAFVAVARLGSLTRAAAQLCRTQGAVSRQIQQLEQHYQRQLFQRRVSGMALTRDGERLYAVASQTLGQLSRFASQALPSPTRLRLRLPSTFALRWFLPRLAAIEQGLPGIRLEISTTVQDQPAFDPAEWDAVVVRGRGDWEGLLAEPLFAEQLTPMCTAELAQDLPAPAALQDCRLIHANGGQQEWQAWWQTHGTGPMPTQYLVFDSLEAAVSAAMQGYGVALADPRLFQAPLSQGALVMPFPQCHDAEYGYYLLTPARGGDAPRQQQLRQVLQSLC